jgi:hypothetical protein
MHKAFAAALCAAFITALTAGSALAGEVQGPPGTPGVPFSGSGQRTAAPSHSNSICSFSGLNDMNPAQGPINVIVQSPGQDVVNGSAPPGSPGHGTCAGGSNPENPPTP